jgi:hypothetical protein
VNIAANGQATIASSATSTQIAIAMSAATMVRDSPRDLRATAAGPAAAGVIVAPAAPLAGLVAADPLDPFAPPAPADLVDSVVPEIAADAPADPRSAAALLAVSVPDARATAVVGRSTAAGWPASRASGPVAELHAVRIVLVSHPLTAAVPALPTADFGAAVGTGMAGRCSIVDTPGRDGSGAGVASAISSATRSSAARITEGSGVSAIGLIEPMRAPAEAAVEPPAGLASRSGRVGALVSDRHRSSHSSVVPPHPLT